MGKPVKGHWSEKWPLLSKGATPDERAAAKEGEDLTALAMTVLPSWIFPPGFGKKPPKPKDPPFDEYTPSLEAYREAAEILAKQATDLSREKRLIYIAAPNAVGKGLRSVGLDEFEVKSGRRTRNVQVEESAQYDLDGNLMEDEVSGLDALHCFPRTDRYGFPKKDKYSAGPDHLTEYALPPQIEQLPAGSEKDRISKAYRAARRAGESPSESLKTASVARRAAPPVTPAKPSSAPVRFM